MKSASFLGCRSGAKEDSKRHWTQSAAQRPAVVTGSKPRRTGRQNPQTSVPLPRPTPSVYLSPPLRLTGPSLSLSLSPSLPPSLQRSGERGEEKVCQRSASCVLRWHALTRDHTASSSSDAAGEICCAHRRSAVGPAAASQRCGNGSCAELNPRTATLLAQRALRPRHAAESPNFVKTRPTRIFSPF